MVFCALFLFCAEAFAEEVPFTLEDRDRLIRVETTLTEFKESVNRGFGALETRFSGTEKRFDFIDKRFDGIDKRIDRVDATITDEIEGVNGRIEGVEKRLERLETVMMGGFGLIFTSMIGLVGFVLWDRKGTMGQWDNRTMGPEEHWLNVSRSQV